MPTRAEFEGAAGPCRVWFLSADNPDSIRGFGFQGIVLDEAAAVPAAVWNYVLRPTLAQTLGWAVFISTLMGRNWFYDMFTRGVEGRAGLRFFHPHFCHDPHCRSGKTVRKPRMPDSVPTPK